MPTIYTYYITALARALSPEQKKTEINFLAFKKG